VRTPADGTLCSGKRRSSLERQGLESVAKQQACAEAGAKVLRRGCRAFSARWASGAGMSAGVPKYVTINLRQLTERFAEGETVSLETLKAKRVLNVSGKEARLPLKARKPPPHSRTDQWRHRRSFSAATGCERCRAGLGERRRLQVETWAGSACRHLFAPPRRGAAGMRPLAARASGAAPC
jgi:hypothetical protein